MRAFAVGRALALSAGLEPPADLAPLLGRLGLEVVPWRFEGRVREVIIGSAVGIDERLPEPWARWLTAHAVGHRLLHTGTSLYLESWQWVNRVKAERQAEEFAAGLLLLADAGRFAGSRTVASRCGIPELKAAWALALDATGGGAYTRP